MVEDTAQSLKRDTARAARNRQTKPLPTCLLAWDHSRPRWCRRALARSSRDRQAFMPHFVSFISSIRAPQDRVSSRNFCVYERDSLSHTQAFGVVTCPQDHTILCRHHSPPLLRGAATCSKTPTRRVQLCPHRWIEDVWDKFSTCKCDDVALRVRKRVRSLVYVQDTQC